MIDCVEISIVVVLLHQVFVQNPFCATCRHRRAAKHHGMTGTIKLRPP